MSSITTLVWNGDTAYGPKGVRYDLTPTAGLYLLTANGATVIEHATKVAALQAALAHATGIQKEIEAEANQINGASRNFSHI